MGSTRACYIFINICPNAKTLDATEFFLASPITLARKSGLAMDKVNTGTEAGNAVP